MRLLAPCVAHQDIEAREPAHGSRDHLFTDRLIAYVAGQCDAFASRFANQPYHLLSIRFLIGEVTDGNVRAFTGKGDCGGAAHSRIAAGDERFPPRQPPGSLVAALAMVGLRIHFGRESRPRLILIGKWRFGIFHPGVSDRDHCKSSPRLFGKLYMHMAQGRVAPVPFSCSPLPTPAPATKFLH